MLAHSASVESTKAVTDPFGASTVVGELVPSSLACTKTRCRRRDRDVPNGKTFGETEPLGWGVFAEQAKQALGASVTCQPRLVNVEFRSLLHPVTSRTTRADAGEAWTFVRCTSRSLLAIPPGVFIEIDCGPALGRWATVAWRIKM